MEKKMARLLRTDTLATIFSVVVLCAVFLFVMPKVAGTADSKVLAAVIRITAVLTLCFAAFIAAAVTRHLYLNKKEIYSEEITSCKMPVNREGE